MQITTISNGVSRIKNSNKGAVALLLVIMITALTVVSVVVVSMTNISDLMSAYYFSEAEEVGVDLDACLDDAMFRLASTTAASGTYYLSGVGTNCFYQISSTIVGGLKTVTSTASTTSSIGYWEDTVVVQVNVSSTPISIHSYKNSNTSFASYEYCGNGFIEGDEVCDDGYDEYCGDGITQDGSFCNSSCSGYDSLSEACDAGVFVEDDCEVVSGYWNQQGSKVITWCKIDCSALIFTCP